MNYKFNLSEAISGKIISSVEGLEKQSEEVIIKFDTGESIKMLHHQDCCESVWLEDYEAPKNLSGATMLELIVSENQDDTDWGTRTWTFYKFQTTKGELFLRWCGESNGYYSEDVDVYYFDADGNCPQI